MTSPFDEFDVKPFKVAETPDSIAFFVVGGDDPETAVKVAGVLRVINAGKGAARLYIDDVMFGYATVDGFDVHTGPRKLGGHNGLPSVTLTIVASRVEVVDDIKPPSLQHLEAEANAELRGRQLSLDDASVTREADMVEPAHTVYTGVVSSECLCLWRSGVDSLELEKVDPVCPLHGRGAPFDATADRPAHDCGDYL